MSPQHGFNWWLLKHAKLEWTNSSITCVIAERNAFCGLKGLYFYIYFPMDTWENDRLRLLTLSFVTKQVLLSSHVPNILQSSVNHMSKINLFLKLCKNVNLCKCVSLFILHFLLLSNKSISEDNSMMLSIQTPLKVVTFTLTSTCSVYVATND